MSKFKLEHHNNALHKPLVLSLSGGVPTFSNQNKLGNTDLAELSMDTCLSHRPVSS